MKDSALECFFPLRRVATVMLFHARRFAVGRNVDFV